MNNSGVRQACAAVGAALVILSIVPAAARAQTPGTVTIGSSFSGLDQQFLLTPPDTDGAIGPGGFVEFVNGSFALYNATTGALITHQSAQDFWTLSGVDMTGRFAFDPRIVYDAASGHWFATSVDDAGPSTPGGPPLNHFLVSVSNTSDPLGGWKGFAINSSSSGDHWADFPTLGVNANGIYLGANMVNPTTNMIDTANLLVLPKSDLISGSVANATLFNNLDPATTGFSLQPVVSLNNTGMPHPIIADDGGNLGQVKMTQVDGPVTTPTLDKSFPVQQGLPTSVPADNVPPPAPQPGTTAVLNTNDNRFAASVVLVNGNIWAVQTANLNGRSALHWERINPSTGVIVDSGYIGNAVQSYYFGSIAVNANGDIVIGFNASDSNSTFASAYAIVGKFDGSNTAFGTPFLLKAGEGPYGTAGAKNRWGDYSATTVDPNNPNDFWTIQEYAKADPNNPGSFIEGTWITELIISPLVPEPSSLVLGSCGALGLAALLRRRRSKGA